jgi:hypothetical protein
MTSSFHQVHYGQNWVMKNNPGARIFHDGLDLRPHFRVIAMDGAIGAKGFFDAKYAAGQPLIPIGNQVFAVFAGW